MNLLPPTLRYHILYDIYTVCETVRVVSELCADVQSLNTIVYCLRTVHFGHVTADTHWKRPARPVALADRGALSPSAVPGPQAATARSPRGGAREGRCRGCLPPAAPVSAGLLARSRCTASVCSSRDQQTGFILIHLFISFFVSLIPFK